MSVPAIDAQQAAILRALQDTDELPDGLSSIEIMRTIPERFRGPLSPFGRLLRDMKRRELVRVYRSPSRHNPPPSTTQRWRITYPGRQALDQAERRAREQAS